MSVVVDFLSGEFFLRSRPNGGTAVLLRSLWVTTLICAMVLPIKSYCAAGTELAFSAVQLKVELGQMIPWFGAVFAGAYAAFYSRFAAQWSYLASLYNQITATVASAPADHFPNEAFIGWNAAFIEDAQDLHLARKSMFASVIKGLLQDPQVVRVFLSYTDGGPNRLRDLERQLNCAAATPAEVDFVTAQSIQRAVENAAVSPPA
ncbi:hypothetical protein SE336_00735 [Xanthomonas arboricola]|uniref:hypothetical protein n=1 Tax=Xanthomonas arboricola TaxID=56448 RepID=UPI0039F47B63